MAAMATSVKRAAEMRPTESPKLSRPTARPPRMTVKLSQERNVRSLAKKTFGSTRVGRAIRLPTNYSVRIRGIMGDYKSLHTGSSLQQWLGRHTVHSYCRSSRNTPGDVAKESLLLYQSVSRRFDSNATNGEAVNVGTGN